MSNGEKRKLFAELIGTFFLVLVIGMTGNPIAIGITLMTMVYATGATSGGHLNPAVTLGVWLRGRLPSKLVIPYMIAQCVGGTLAAFTVIYLKAPATGMLTPSPMCPEVMPSLLAEFLITFALVFTVLQVATAKATAGNSYFGFAIGAVVLGGAFAVGSISGGAFNPAVAVAISILGAVTWSSIWIFLVANLAAGAVAAATFKMMHPEDK